MSRGTQGWLCFATAIPVGFHMRTRRRTLAIMKICELNHVALHVSDVTRSCEFYIHVLRLERLARPAFDFAGAWFRLGEQQELHLINRTNETIPPGNRNNHFALKVDDLAAWEEHLEKIGASFRGPKPRPDGAMQIFLADPDGHYIELFTPP